MTKILMAIALCFSSLIFVNTVSAQEAAAHTYVTGVVEHVEAMENEAMVKLVGAQKLLIIKNLMSFPEAKLQALVDSQDAKTFVKLKVNAQNQILDVIL